MTSHTAARQRLAAQWPLGLFALLVAVIYGLALCILAALPALPGAPILLNALSIDLTLTISAAYYFLLVRRQGWPASSTLGVFIASLAAAELLLPAGKPGLLPYLAYLAAPLELVLLYCIGRPVVLALRQLRKGLQSAEAGVDLLALLRETALANLKPALLAELLASELAVFCYAFGRPAQPCASATRFSYHEECNYGPLILGLLLLCGFELIGLHFLIAYLWSAPAAWVISALSAYGCLWLLGDYKAALARPLELGADCLHLRIGLRWSLDIPYSNIAGLERRAANRDAEGQAELRLLLSGEENCRLLLLQPQTASGIYGIRRCGRSIALGLDKPQAFATALQARLAAQAQLRT